MRHRLSCEFLLRLHSSSYYFDMHFYASCVLPGHLCSVHQQHIVNCCHKPVLFISQSHLHNCMQHHLLITDCNTNTHTDEVVVTLDPVSLSVNEGEDANFTCSPFLDERFPVFLNTISPGADEPEIPPTSLITITNVDGTRVFTWLNSSLNDHGRKFFCQLGPSSSNKATLYINRKCLSYWYVYISVYI